MTASGSALVSGASRGLGAHIARRPATDGWPVAVNYCSDRAGAERVVADIVAAGGRAAAFAADVIDEHEVPAMVAAVEASLGPVRVVVANATGPQPAAPAEQVSWPDHLDQLVFFVKSPALLMQATLPGMKRLGGGRIIHLGSDSFERAIPGASAYNAAKGAQIGLARTWARELGAYGVTVNIVGHTID
ncbi:SDR family NAD(P)-dependent oxidoreductase [Micromonosporaceae bacterium Da 78-11]